MNAHEEVPPEDFTYTEAEYRSAVRMARAVLTRFMGRAPAAEAITLQRHHVWAHLRRLGLR